MRPEINAPSLSMADAGRLAGLARQFHRTIERQRQRDAAIFESILRSMKSPENAKRFAALVRLKRGS